MDFRKRIIGPCARLSCDDPDVSIVDVGTFLLRLLLFEKCILKSIRLTEFTDLIKVFGFEGVREVLNSGAVDILCEARMVGSFRESAKPLPPFSYKFEPVTAADPLQYRRDCLSRMEAKLRIDSRSISDLKDLISRRITAAPCDSGKKAFAQFKIDLMQKPGLAQTAIAMLLTQKLGGHVAPTDFGLTIHQSAEDAFRVETTACTKFGLAEHAGDKLVEQGLLAVSSLNYRLLEMEEHTALSGFQEGDLPLFDRKIEFLLRPLDPQRQIEQFCRVVMLLNLPNLESIAREGHVNLSKLLEVRETKECREFRDWLRGLGSATDEEIEQRVASLKARLAVFAHSGKGKLVRWVASTGMGAIPGVGLVAGAGIGLLDTFLVEKLLPHDGPVFFLSELYPRVFAT